MNKQDLEYLCQKLRNGEYDGKDIMQAWIAIEELQSYKDTIFKYSLNQKVKVQVFNIITTGIIIKRQSYETNSCINFKYTLEYGEGFNEIVEAWEKDLDFVKDLPLGEMK